MCEDDDDESWERCIPEVESQAASRKKIIRSTSAMDSEAVRLASIKNEREDRQEYETSEQRTVYPGLLLDVSHS